MNVFSLITPVYQPVPEYLEAAAKSVLSQELPEGWELEWLIQEDGQTGAAEAIVPTDNRVRFGSGRHGGVAITRNLALSRARGRLVKNLDQDDILTPGVITRDIEAMASPDIGWTTSRVLDLLPDGSTESFPGDPEPGRLQPGWVRDQWEQRSFRLPVHPTTMCILRTLAVQLGGWMAVPGSDDTGLLIAASMVSVGYFEGEVGALYRKWPGQSSASLAHVESVEWNARMKLINERALSLGSYFDRRTAVPTTT